MAGREGRALGKVQGRKRSKHVAYQGPTQLSPWGTGPCLSSQPRWPMVQGTPGDLATMVSGARATGQILKIINREEKSLGVRSQSPRRMYVSSVNS